LSTLEQNQISKAALTAEGALFARYLRGKPASQTALERYEAGCEALFAEPPSPEDEAISRFLERHPWTLPWLDAATALLRPQALLRKKLLLLLAILETLPENAQWCEPHPSHRALALARLCLWGATSALKAAGGAVLLPFALRTRSVGSASGS
jgi:hypothetical protein